MPTDGLVAEELGLIMDRIEAIYTHNVPEGPVEVRKPFGSTQTVGYLIKKDEMYFGWKVVDVDSVINSFGTLDHAVVFEGEFTPTQTAAGLFGHRFHNADSRYIEAFQFDKCKVVKCYTSNVSYIHLD